jgi:thiamine monophosphate synthase
MFIVKKKYFLILESIKDINLKHIKKYNKFIIIYRNTVNKDNINELIKFRKICKLKLIEFYVANDIKLCVLLNSDGIYLSSYNKTLKTLNLKTSNFKIIGSAHNFKEINFKIKQGCSYILLSKLFPVDYALESSSLGVIKFNRYSLIFNNILVPLGGIKANNLNSLRHAECSSFAILSAIKKKPTNIISRLF